MKNMSKWNSKRVAMFVLVACILAGSTLAYSGQKKIDVIYNNIKILIDGKEYTPKDANGNIVEPFTYNGTTYVPLRAVASAFDKEVNWDGKTATVSIGSQSYTWFDTLGTYDSTSASGNSYNESVSNIKNYTRGLRMVIKASDEVRQETSKSTYLLNGEYKTFSASLLSDGREFAEPGNVFIYGDGVLLYTSPGITESTPAQNIELNITGVLQLTIEVKCDLTYSSSYRNICFADARLLK